MRVCGSGPQNGRRQDADLFGEPSARVREGSRRRQEGSNTIKGEQEEAHTAHGSEELLADQQEGPTQGCPVREHWAEQKSPGSRDPRGPAALSPCLGAA